MINSQRRGHSKDFKLKYTPSHLVIYVTFKCNFRCHGCNFLLNDEDAFEDSDFISIANFKKILNLSKGQRKTIAFGGGEPTLHPKFNDLVKETIAFGYKPTMSTNGSRLTKVYESLRHFAKINVSMDSYNYDSFYKNRGTSQKLYNAILEGLEMMRKGGIKFNLSYCISKDRLSEIDKFIEFTKNYLPQKITLHAMSPHKDDSIEYLDWNDTEVQSFYRDLLRRNDFDCDISLPYAINENNDDFKSAKCPKIWDGSYVHHNGDMAYCCHLAPEPKIGNVLNGDDHNSKKNQMFRKAMLKGGYKIPDCTYCQRRFDKVEKPYFDNKLNKWLNIPEYVQEIL